MNTADTLPSTVLGRTAVAYIQQSTQAQVMTNLESRIRPYDLVELARKHGFASAPLTKTRLQCLHRLEEGLHNDRRFAMPRSARSAILLSIARR